MNSGDNNGRKLGPGEQGRKKEEKEEENREFEMNGLFLLYLVGQSKKKMEQKIKLKAKLTSMYRLMCKYPVFFFSYYETKSQ